MIHSDYGIDIGGHCRIVHGKAAHIKQPFPHFSLQMHELSAGCEKGFSGQFGLIPFRTEYRMPRHVHVGEDPTTGKPALLPERILVMNGAGLVELLGEYFVIASGTLLDIGAGVPHTWTACPAGLVLPDGSVTPGTFDMVYNYEVPTDFYPVMDTGLIERIEDCHPYAGAIEDVFFPEMSLDIVKERARLVWNDEVRSLTSRDEKEA